MAKAKQVHASENRRGWVHDLMFDNFSLPDALPELWDCIGCSSQNVHDGDVDRNPGFFDDWNERRQIHIGAQAEVWIFHRIEVGKMGASRPRP